MTNKETNVQVVYHNTAASFNRLFDLAQQSLPRRPSKPFVFKPSRTKIGWEVCRNEIRNTKIVPGNTTLDLSALKVTGYLFENRVAACCSLSLYHFDWVQLIGRSGGSLHLLCTRDEKATIVVAKYK